MNEILSGALFGIVGGIGRAVLGLLDVASEKREIKWGNWLFALVAAIISGAILGMLFNFDWRVSILAGLAGTQLLKTIYKSFTIKKIALPYKALSIQALPKKKNAIEKAIEYL